MSALVERIIAARDSLKGLNISNYALIADARDVMADAANAITERDELITRLSAEGETLRSDLLDAKDDIDRLTGQLDPCKHCCGSRLETFVSYGNSVGERPCSFCCEGG